MAIVCPENDTSGTCSLMSGAGAGLGIFIQYMGVALPPLLIILGIVGIIVAVGFGIAGLLKKGISGVHTR